MAGAINRHKTGEPVAQPPGGPHPAHPRNNVYVNPNYRPVVKSFKPPSTSVAAPRPASRPTATTPQEKRDVVIDGVAFESSGRSLVRKDCKYHTLLSVLCNVAPSSRCALNGRYCHLFCDI